MTSEEQRREDELRRETIKDDNRLRLTTFNATEHRQQLTAAVSAYEAHFSKTCSCTTRRVGFVTSTIKRTEDDERVYIDGTTCPVGFDLWKVILGLVAIPLTVYGETLTLYPDMEPLRWEDSDPSCCAGLHDMCRGFVDIKRVSPTHQALLCRSCHMRVMVPASIKKISDLRAHIMGVRVLVETSP